jgi:putative DNA primase/helicase
MRTCVFAGTINDSEYLPDMTGNRRYWPVKIYGLDKQALIDDRDQLFAEALFRYERGDKWWPEDMEFHAMAEIQQESRLLRDPWESQVEALHMDECSVTDIYSHLSLPSGQRTQENRRRIVNVLQRLGYTQFGKDLFRK